MENARLLGELRQRTEEVEEFNRGLEARVAAQVDELGRVGRLKRFLAPQLAELIVSHGDENISLKAIAAKSSSCSAICAATPPSPRPPSLRRCSTSCANITARSGPLVSQFEGTLDQFSGDGIMVFFNDPVPCPDPAERAVKMAIAMREAAGALIAMAGAWP